MQGYMLIEGNVGLVLQLYFSIDLFQILYTESFGASALCQHKNVMIKNLKKWWKKTWFIPKKTPNRFRGNLRFFGGGTENKWSTAGLSVVAPQCNPVVVHCVRTHYSNALKILYPKGALASKMLRPDAMLLMDSYNKLKPCGIYMSGCMDGFCWHYMWKAYVT